MPWSAATIRAAYAKLSGRRLTGGAKGMSTAFAHQAIAEGVKGRKAKKRKRREG